MDTGNLGSDMVTLSGEQCDRYPIMDSVGILDEDSWIYLGYYFQVSVRIQSRKQSDSTHPRHNRFNIESGIPVVVRRVTVSKAIMKAKGRYQRSRY